MKQSKERNLRDSNFGDKCPPSKLGFVNVLQEACGRLLEAELFLYTVFISNCGGQGPMGEVGEGVA